MAIMEGPLSKWTNVMKGWQYRWFVLDESAGLLSYYTSKDKMMRGARRGCVRLKGAVIGIDDEDDSTFTITVDQKTFHFQARDAEEKERWIGALENTILRHSQPTMKWDNRPTPTMHHFEKKLSETDAYLQILIDQVQALGAKIALCEDEASRDKYNHIKGTAESMIESIKQSIVLLQITKQNVTSQFPSGSAADDLRLDSTSLDVSSSHAAESGASSQLSRSTECINRNSDSGATAAVGAANHSCSLISASMPNLTADVTINKDNPVADVSGGSSGAGPHALYEGASGTQQGAAQSCPAADPSSGLQQASVIPDHSYSSSEDEDFFDAEDDTVTGEAKVNGTASGEEQEPRSPPKVIASHDDYFDELYDQCDEDDLESMDQHGSLITHLLSQVRIGMDLTKVVLPTFILEKRSLLEMYADFFAHPDLFIGIVDQKTPRDRMVQTVRWYLSAFHAGRKSHVAKKPYNPILGETFKCHYDLPNVERSKELADDGPLPYARKDNLVFIAEQVSHHPPISAFYAECHDKRISLDGYIWTKSKFLGLSIGVHMIGQGVMTVIDYDEDYLITFPNGYGRSILTVPWMELGGKVLITCAKTGYSATIDFHTKPFYGGKKDQITAEIYPPNDKKSFCTIKGEWNGVMWAKYTTGMNEIFIDTKNMAIVKKLVHPIDHQEEFESRRLWRDVTYNLKAKNIELATDAKHALEQRQREEAKERKETGEQWQTKHFNEVGEHWVYHRPLIRRLGHIHQDFVDSQMELN